MTYEEHLKALMAESLQKITFAPDFEGHKAMTNFLNAFKTGPAGKITALVDCVDWIDPAIVADLKQAIEATAQSRSESDDIQALVEADLRWPLVHAGTRTDHDLWAMITDDATDQYHGRTS